MKSLSKIAIFNVTDQFSSQCNLYKGLEISFSDILLSKLQINRTEWTTQPNRKLIESTHAECVNGQIRGGQCSQWRYAVGREVYPAGCNECWVSVERSAAAAWPRSHSSQDGGGWGRDWQASNKIRRPGWAVYSPLFPLQGLRLLFTFSHMHYSAAQELPEKGAPFRDPLALVLFC